MDIIDDAKPLTAPSQGGDLLTWVQAQIGYSEARRSAADLASGEAFHRGVVECLREVLAGLVPLVAERDELRNRVVELEKETREFESENGWLRSKADRLEATVADWNGYCASLTERLAPGRRMLLSTAVADALARIAELEAAQRWVPVDSQLPDAGVPVLFVGPDVQQAVAVYVGGDDPWRLDADRTMAMEASEVTHWRPLPAGPEVRL